MIIKMEKIKASEVLAIIKKNYRFLCRDTDGTIVIATNEPQTEETEKGVSWYEGEHVTDGSFDNIVSIGKVGSLSRKESLSSLREIDFSEDFTEEKLSLISNGTQIEPKPNPIFKLDDTVHVLSYSNVGEFGKSTEGIIKTIYKDGTVLVKVDEGVEEVHKEDNVSFTPFSIKEAGFSQVRPVPEPKEGDYGFFYDSKPRCDFFIYGMLETLKHKDEVYRYKIEGRSFWKYFSIEPPQLADGIPNPFTKC